MTATPRPCMQPLPLGWAARSGFGSLALVVPLLLVTPSFAQGQTSPSPAAPWQFKLTPSLYSTTGQGQASDVNLRVNRDGHAVWVGHFQQTGEGQQTRTGYEYTTSTHWGQVVPSLQAATGGFMGGSVNLQVGQKIYAMAGWGRTNLRSYYNLNFDPNDAITLGIGGWWTERHQLALFRVQDDRLGTGQQVTHALWRYHPIHSQRLTVDLAYKRGRTDAQGEMLHGHSLTLDWDWDAYFVRLAFDQKVNFSTTDQQRLSLGYRF